MPNVIDYPADGTMLVLLAHEAGDRLTVKDGALHLTVQSEDRTIPAPTAALDDLEDRGWLRVLPDGRTEITDRGKYWLTRWLTKRLGKGRLVKTDGFRVTGTTITGERQG